MMEINSNLNYVLNIQFTTRKSETNTFNRGIHSSHEISQLFAHLQNTRVYLTFYYTDTDILFLKKYIPLKINDILDNKLN